VAAPTQTERGCRPQERRDVHGVLLLDKPRGITSNQALQRVKRLYRARKAGHTGSLDPLASGMLPVCFGEATKFAGHLLAADKVYRVRASFGIRTDTGDADGEPVASGPREVSAEALVQALKQFRGSITQTPPMYSALKRNGRRLYELARAGQEISRESRSVRIAELVLEQADPQKPVLRVCCSKGTYIRTLVEDIAAAAGTVGHVLELRRLAVLPFAEAAMIDVEALDRTAPAGEEALDNLLLPVDCLLAGFPAARLSAAEAHAVRQGSAINSPLKGVAGGLMRLYDEADRLIGLGEMMPDGRLAPRRLVAQQGSPVRARLAGL
jgi:tRNA pseudouridine55 synthase